jgi:glycosyltransferase involved in cell wall biosynthesis
MAASIHEPHEIWHPNHWPAQWASVWLKKRLGGCVVWMSNDVPIFFESAQLRGSLWQRIRALVQWLYYLYDRHVNRAVDLTLLLSSWAEREFQAIYPGHTRIVHPGMDPERFSPSGCREKIRARFGYSPQDFVLLWLGIFMPHRRLEDAIIALSFLVKRGTPVRLLLAGSEQEYTEYACSLRQLTTRLGLNGAVTFAGRVLDEEIGDFYCACDAFLFPNNHQTWGLAVLEAMSCGCPALVSTGAGVQDVLTDHENALLFPPLNPEAMANAIELIASDSDLRAKIAGNGMQLARTALTWKAFSEELVDIFLTIQIRESSQH